MASGRWHTTPNAVIYCSDESYTAYCEILRQIGLPSLFPDDYKFLKIECPASTAIEEVDIDQLDPQWASKSLGWRICRPIGDEWLRSGRTALLKVPSAARLGSFNYLLNPAAYQAEDIVVSQVIDQPFPDDLTKIVP